MNKKPSMLRAIYNDDPAEVRTLLADTLTPQKARHLKSAVQGGNLEIVRLLLDAGYDLHAEDSNGRIALLSNAISKDAFEVAQELLKRGANPNSGRALVTAVNERKSPDRQLAFLQLLVEHGAEVNSLYPLYGDNEKQFTVLDWAQHTNVKNYLRENGAKTAKELLGTESGLFPNSRHDELAVLSFAQESFGPVASKAVSEVFPSGRSMLIRISELRDSLVLFTVGLSSHAMPVPLELKDYVYAELFVELPKDWDLTAPATRWPVEWMLNIARHPVTNNTHLGGPFTIVANGEPPEKLAPGVPFTGMMLFAEKSFVRPQDGATVQFYRLVPIFTEERHFELEHGAAALFLEFDRQSVPFVVDINRKCIAIN